MSRQRTMTTPGDGELGAHARQLGVTAAIAVAGGREILNVGDVARPIGLHSLRKPLLSALYGQAHDRGLIDLATTIGDLGIDDTPPLTEEEKAATIEDLLCSRSGVYLPAEDGRNPLGRPARGAHPPGTHWVYNNWDFNLLGHIYERLTHKSLYLAFDRQLATPLGMTDWDAYEHSSYEYRADILGETPRYPNYSIQLSTRDLVRFGQLYLQRGRHGDAQLLSEEWIDRSTQPISRTSHAPGLLGTFGYCWWVAGPEADLPDTTIPVGTYSTAGFGGSFLTIIPALNALVAIMIDTHAPPAPPSSAPMNPSTLLAEGDYVTFLRHVIAYIG